MSGPNELSPNPATTQDACNESIESLYQEYCVSENPADTVSQTNRNMKK